MVAFQRSGLLDAIGEKNVLGNIDEALLRAVEIAVSSAPAASA
jgi:hypothetical protein